MKLLTLLFLLLPLWGSAQLLQPGLLLTVQQDPSGRNRDIEVIYRDPGRCTDESFIDLITEAGHVALKPVRHHMSCQIVSWGRITTDEGLQMLKTSPLIMVRIENPASESVYYFPVTDKNYLMRVLKD